MHQAQYVIKLWVKSARSKSVFFFMEWGWYSYNSAWGQFSPTKQDRQFWTSLSHVYIHTTYLHICWESQRRLGFARGGASSWRGSKKLVSPAQRAGWPARWPDKASGHSSDSHWHIRVGAVTLFERVCPAVWNFAWLTQKVAPILTRLETRDVRAQAWCF